MDGRQFDAFAKSVGAAATRRQMLKGIVGAAGLGLAAALGMRSPGSQAQEETIAGTPIALEPTAEPTVEATIEATLEPTLPAVETVEPTAPASPTASATSTPPATPTQTATPTASPTATRESRASVSATPAITTVPKLGKVKTNIQVNGTGFANGEAVQIVWFNGTSRVPLGSTTAASGGSFTFNAPVPSAFRGPHKVRAEGASSGNADASFSVQQALRLQNRRGLPGSNALLIIDGFAARVAVNILFFPSADGTGTPVTISTLTTSSTGRASLNWTVPNNATPGVHRMRAVEQVSGKLSNADFRVLCPNGQIDNGAGACVACQSAGQCPQPASALCGTATCTNGVCGMTFVTAGTRTATDPTANCKRSQCDGQGREVIVNDDSDLPLDLNSTDCTTPSCVNGQPSTRRKPVRSTCLSGSAQGICNADGICVSCIDDSDCPDRDGSFCGTGVCRSGVCAFRGFDDALPPDQQIVGDCFKKVCNEAGGIAGIFDDTDIVHVAGTCVDRICENGSVISTNLPRRSTCTQNGGKLCDGNGNCLTCMDNTDCPPSTIPNASKICAEVNVGGFFACVDLCNPGLEICTSNPNVCTPLNTVDNCGFCGIVCPGDTATSDPVCLSGPGGRACAITCVADNFDVDGSAANGCEAKNVLAATGRGGKTCGTSGQADTITGTIVSDNRVHSPAPANFNAATGAIPHVYTAVARAGALCTGTAAVQVSTSGGSAATCYRVRAIIGGVDRGSITMNGRETKSFTFPYAVGNTVTFRLEKTCGASTVQKVNYSIGYRFL